MFATLVRLLGSFDPAEEALHDAFLAAAEQWPERGVPANPAPGWSRPAASRRSTGSAATAAWSPGTRPASGRGAWPTSAGLGGAWDEREAIEDDRLRLVFTCCHPSLAEEARIALTLREVCGLTTEAIAAAFLMPTPTLAQRIVRAKAKIAAARIPYEVPGPAERPARLASVLRVVYLVFNEGHARTRRAGPGRGGDPAGPAARTRCCRSPRSSGLLALHAAAPCAPRARARSPPASSCRSRSRTEARGTTPPSPKAARWPRRRCRSAGFGAYALQAAIAAVHAEAASVAATDWAQIVGLYDALLRVEPSPVIALNRAVAVAHARRARGRAGARRAAACRPCRATTLPRPRPPTCAAAPAGVDEAAAHYRAALALARQEPERLFLMRRLAEVEALRIFSRGAVESRRRRSTRGCRQHRSDPSTTQETPCPRPSPPTSASTATTREAFAFYEQALGAKIQAMMSYADMPPSAMPERRLRRRRRPPTRRRHHARLPGAARRRDADGRRHAARHALRGHQRRDARAPVRQRRRGARRLPRAVAGRTGDDAARCRRSGPRPSAC